MIVNFYSWNINGLRAILKKGYLIDFIEKYNPDVLAIQETKVDYETFNKDKKIKEFTDYLKEKGYLFEHNPSKVKKGWSGVLTIVKEELKPRFEKETGIKEMDQEGRIIKTFFDIKKLKDLVFYNVYFPNGKANDERLKYKLWFYDRFLEHILKEKEQGIKHIIGCDLNTAHKEIDLARPKENENVSGFLPIEREWIDKFLSFGFIDTFRFLYPDKIKYSWWSMRTRARERNVGWRIDYFFISEELKKHLIESDILTNIYGSDHAPIYLKMGF
jgi:exodeoxyribonuclease-3